MRARMTFVLLCAFIAGCGFIPSKTESWCLPKLKYGHVEKRAYAGVRCDW